MALAPLLVNSMAIAKKSLGQHWLNDPASLQAMCSAVELNNQDTVLEIGPGLGSLTKFLVRAAKQVIAIELDEELGSILPHIIGADNLKVTSGNILEFNLSELPAGYKVVANIPYYLTGKILRMFADAHNQPAIIALLVQKEVAQRIAAGADQMSILSVAVQLHYEVRLDKLVLAKLFSPPPKVDSQIIVLSQRLQPLFDDIDVAIYMRLVKAGFSSPRKKLRSSLSAGLGIDKSQAEQLLGKAGISPDDRAQNLSVSDWYSLYKAHGSTDII